MLIEKLAQIHAGYFGYEGDLDEEDLADFLKIEFGRVGADTHLTPREVIRDFIELLDIMCQNPDVTLKDLLNGEGGSDGGCTFLSTSANGSATGDDAPFAEFTI